MSDKAEQLTLPQVVTVHCCFCKHTEITTTDVGRSDPMEDHYYDHHRQLIEHYTGSHWQRDTR